MKQSRLHFMGIGGQGISAVAQMARLAGDVVTGCDQRASATTQLLERAGIAVDIGHSDNHLREVDALVVSPAISALDANNTELQAARTRGIRIMPWQALLGELMSGKCVLSVSGVHGKGTTTAMLALMLVDAGLDPTCEIGAVVPRFEANYRLGKSQYFVNEADEFNHNFWHYHPRVTIVTSIEFEHPEFFADEEAFLAAFTHFIGGMDMSGTWSLPPALILNADSPGCLELRERVGNWPGRIVTYSVEGLSQLSQEQATYQAYDLKLDGQTSFRVRSQNSPAFPEDVVISLQLPGIPNIQNAMAALTAAHLLEVDARSIASTLKSFNGIRRRFEIRNRGLLKVNGKELDVVLVDDYAHHPTAITATLESFRRRYPERRIVAVYQPHMYSRTRTFFSQFLTAFDAADVAIIMDIFPAREYDTGLVHARELVEVMTKRSHFSQPARQVIYGGDVRATTQLLRTTMRSGDLVLIMGAGDVYMVTEMLLQDDTQERGKSNSYTEGC